MKLLVGYKVPSGEPFYLEKLHHAIFTGITQWAGKTTAIEALITRSGLRAVTFVTKPDEQQFNGHRLPLFFRERADWQYVESLISATLREDQRFNRSFIIKTSRGAKSLREVWDNIKTAKDQQRSGSFVEGVYTNLDAYMEIVVPQIEEHRFSQELKLEDGLNVMDLSDMTDEMQALVIRSVLEALEKLHNVVVVIPEAWKFLGNIKTPVSYEAEKLVRQKASGGVYMWSDSQNIMGIEENVRAQFGFWFLGIQRYEHEVERTIKAIPLENKPKKTEIMNLETGQFIVCTRKDVEKVYVQPSWLPDELARKVAMGELEADSEGVQQFKGAEPILRPGEDTSLLTQRLEEDWSDVERRIQEVEAKIG